MEIIVLGSGSATARIDFDYREESGLEDESDLEDDSDLEDGRLTLVLDENA